MRKAPVVVSAALLVVVGAGVCLSIWKVRSALNDTQQQVSIEGNLAFTLAPWKGDAGGFEALPAPNGFTTGATLDGKLYLAGPAGVAVYGSVGAPSKMLQTGLELPPAPVVALQTGRLRGESDTQLFAATRGEGVLILGQDAAGNVDVRQLRSADEAARNVTAVLPLASGDLLIGTQRAGLLIYNGQTLRVFAPVFAGLGITALAADGGGFWVGTRTQGVLHWHAGETEAFGARTGLADPEVEDIAVSPQGVYVGTPLGVTEFRDGRPQRVLAQGTFAKALAIDGNKLTIATVDQGVREVDLVGSLHRVGFELGSGFGQEKLQVGRFVKLPGEGTLAVGDAGVMRSERGGAWQTVVPASTQALADRNVSALNFGADGRLWIGYFDRGLDVLDVQSGRAAHVEDDHIFCVNRIVNDPLRQTMDVATANGLVLFDPQQAQPKERQVLTRRDGLISDQVTDVAFARNGMAVATPAGLTFFTPGGAQSLYAFQGLANNHVYTLAAERGSGRVLAGTLGGISVLEDENVRQNVTLKNSGLKRNWITAMARMDEGNTPAWLVGTYGGGVVQMDEAGRVQTMNGANRTAVINPNAMLVTPQHVLAGSLADGLLVYDRASRRWSQVVAGLPSRNVTAFAERDGEIYVGTENGIVRIAEARLP